jgi:asparagine synthase (glutamine-hydrolysing)
MCAIAGIWTGSVKDPARLTDQARAMSDALRHRGPDDGGVWVDAERSLALAQRRLAIIDLSPAGHQPMISQCGRYVIVFNGECYNFADIRAELVSRGCVFRGHSDTEVILESFAHFGVEPTLQRMVGMFAIALWDKLQANLILMRDRVGKKPLYYGTINGSFLFASELKGFHPAVHGQLSLDPAALKLFLQFGYIPSPLTVFQEVRKLPPGHHVTIPSPMVVNKPIPYWTVQSAYEIASSSHQEMSDGEAMDEFEKLFARGVRERMISDVPLGAFLSGGIDSSLVVASMQAQSTRPVRTFSIAFQEPEFNESPHARLVSEHLGTEHTELLVTAREALEIIPRLPDIYDEPFADASAIPTCLLSQLTRKHVTVSLSGDGGDELFLGYDHYEQAAARIDRMMNVPLLLRRMASGLLGSVPERLLDGACKTTTAFMGSKALGGTRFRSHYILKYTNALAQRTPLGMYRAATADWFNPELALLGNGSAPRCEMADMLGLPRSCSIELFGLYDLAVYIADDILVKVDRASMASSLEARAPLLDHRLVEFALGLPYHFKRRNGVGKWLLRQVLDKYVPRQIVDRPKQGFSVPMGQWLNGPLRDWADHLLSVEGLSRHGIFDPKIIRQRWVEHTSGIHDWSRLLWNILVLQAWLQRWRKG